jgi:hypothetical protein
MKGTLKLIPIDNPVEGMQAVMDYKNIYVHPEVYVIGKINRLKRKTAFLTGVDFTNLERDLSELKQIVVEYRQWGIDERWDNEACMKHKTLPLHPSDWEWAIKHIEEEVEFLIVEDITLNTWSGNSPTVAKLEHSNKLIPSAPIMYTEDEVEQLCEVAMGYLIDGRIKARFNEWWSKNKKKSN